MSDLDLAALTDEEAQARIALRTEAKRGVRRVIDLLDMVDVIDRAIALGMAIRERQWREQPSVWVSRVLPCPDDPGLLDAYSNLAGGLEREQLKDLTLYHRAPDQPPTEGER